MESLNHRIVEISSPFLGDHKPARMEMARNITASWGEFHQQPSAAVQDYCLSMDIHMYIYMNVYVY
jgi:hypothetical protein